MFNIPTVPIYGKKVDKKIIYEKAEIQKQTKNKIIDEIEKIIWAYKISPDTINIKVGQEVGEIEFLNIELKKETLSSEVLKEIDKIILYHTVFCLISNNEYKYIICFKSKRENSEKLDMDKYYETEWTTEDLNIDLNVIDLDQLYYKIFSSISNIDISNIKNNGFDDKNANNENTNQTTKTDRIKNIFRNKDEIEKIKKEIDRLRKKISKEVQDTERQKMNVRIKELKNKIIKLGGE